MSRPGSTAATPVATASRARRVTGGLGIVAAIIVALLLFDRARPAPRATPAAAHAEPAAGTAGDAAGPSRGRATAPAGHAADAASREDAMRLAAEERHLRGLLKEPDPRRRLVAMYLLALKSPDIATRRRMREAIVRLRGEAPDDPLIAQAQEWLCDPRLDPCSEAELAAWASLEPDNAASHLGQLQRAAGDPARQDAVLRSMAQAQRYESHLHAMALETATAFDDYQPPPLGPAERQHLRELGLGMDLASRRQAAAGNHAWALPFPGFVGISRACQPPLPAPRANDCRAVLLRMAGATTQIERMLALSGLERLSRGTPAHAQWAQALDRQRWWSRQFASITTGADYWADFLRHGEIEAMRRALLRAGRPLDPPPGWRAPGT